MYLRKIPAPMGVGRSGKKRREIFGGFPAVLAAARKILYSFLPQFCPRERMAAMALRQRIRRRSSRIPAVSSQTRNKRWRKENRRWPPRVCSVFKKR